MIQSALDINKFAKVRKQWLIAFIIHTNVAYISEVMKYGIKYSSLIAIGNYVAWVGCAFLVPLLLIGIGAFITYYLAYKRHGIVWLYILLWIKPLMLYGSMLLTLPIEAIVTVYYLVNCYKLLQANRKYWASKKTIEGNTQEITLDHT